MKSFLHTGGNFFFSGASGKFLSVKHWNNKRKCMKYAKRIRSVS